METLDQVRIRLLGRFPAAVVSVVTNPSPSGQHSLLLDSAHAVEMATWLRDDPVLRLDTCANVTGIDWPEHEIVEITKTTVLNPGDDLPTVTEHKTTRIQPGFLEVVYHLYSIARSHGPVVLRFRTVNRSDQAWVLSLTPVWRSCEFQEREVFDLFGIDFKGHPDLRRILMWDAFKDHPMRKDYVEPDDYEWEPTPHGSVREKASRHYPAAIPAAPVSSGDTPS